MQEKVLCARKSAQVPVCSLHVALLHWYLTLFKSLMEAGKSDTFRWFIMYFGFRKLFPDGRNSYSDNSGLVESEKLFVARFMTDSIGILCGLILFHTNYFHCCFVQVANLFFSCNVRLPNQAVILMGLSKIAL